ncbi:hypothetical protein TRIUR3_15919 [Triticum urartu]|uniref:Cyclin-B1-2 n=1 Tax=Triticum urartu TaxID=4572 RepID=M8A3V6_TRIUA|nr:hypothetical protein TRIUR3_15919 [Triticum urartu]
MASGGGLMTKKELGETHDVLRFGGNDSENKFWEEKKKFGTEAIYGSAFNIRRDLDAQILSRFQRPPGALPSSMLGYEAMTGSLDDFGFEDYLNLPQDSDSLRIPDMHHGMEHKQGYIIDKQRYNRGSLGIQQTTTARANASADKTSSAVSNLTFLLLP